MRQAKWMFVESWTLEQWYSEPGSFGNGQRRAAPVVLDVDVALFDVDVGRAVLAHRPELHEVGVRDVVAHREQEVQVADHVGLLGLDGGLEALHRVRRRGLLAVVDDRLGLEAGDDALEERGVLDRALVHRDLLAGDLLPGGDPLIQRQDRRQGVGALGFDPAATRVVVDDGYIVAAF